MSVRDLTGDELLSRIADRGMKGQSLIEEAAELRRRLKAGEEAERERDKLRKACEEAMSACGSPDAADGCRLVLAILGAALQHPARRVLGEPSEATKLDDGEFGKAVARGGALRLRGSLHGEPS